MFKDNVKETVSQLFKISPRNADVGVELEIEGLGLPESVNQWTIKPEGSLQNGLEYVSKPIKLDQVHTVMTSLVNKIANVGGVVKNSHRCSTHIHVNVTQTKVEDVLGMMVIFTIYEPLLLSLCGPQRDGNLFCLSSYDTGDLVMNFNQLCMALHRIKIAGFGFDRGKYTSLNSGRLRDLGTLEARCFPLSVEPHTVSQWAGWLVAMRDRAVAEPDKTFRSYWKTVRAHPVWHIQNLFGPAGLTPDSVALVELGTETAYELTKILKDFYKREAAPQKKNRFAKKEPGVFDVSPTQEVQW